jgi:hypothetical protein
MDVESGDPARAALARLAIKAALVLMALYAMACA